MAQASLLERAFLASDANIEEFSKWAATQRSHLFALQSLVDLRNEPRWQYRSSGAEQLKYEFVGRLLNAAKVYETSVANLGLRDLLIEGDKALAKRFPWYLTSMPGPLEGAVGTRESMPQELAEAVLRDLEIRPVAARSFFPLINVRHMFALTDQWPEVVAKALRQSEGGVPSYSDRDELRAVLEGLADIAAVTRSRDIAVEVVACVRNLLRRGAHEIEILDAFQVTIEAAACTEDLESWCAFLGDNLATLAYQPITTADAETLLSSIDWLCHLRPELLRHCARTLAALRSVANQ